MTRLCNLLLSGDNHEYLEVVPFNGNGIEGRVR